jgi:hypothetical protein
MSNRQAERNRKAKLARIRARAAAEFERPADPADPHDALRRILTFLRVPLACEEKACRRARRCVGRYRPDERPWTVPCYDHHDAVLRPFFQKHVLPQLRQPANELEEKF